MTVPEPTTLTSAELIARGYVAHRKSQVTWLMPWTADINMSGVSVSAEDTPELGGYVAINPENPADRWYVAKSYAAKNYVIAA